MGVSAGPDLKEDGLVLCLDGANYKSFKGEVTTNLIPSPTINAYPTTGNAWGSYNTNQYNGAQYFSIGSISSVSNNIITTSTNHPLRTYDVVRPQTSGGGLTGENDYFVKKLSDTTFTLHAYNSSQDGSQGYINPSTGTHKVYDNIANDTRISVNSQNFPTMWWGAPHLPNSGLVKELRYGEFNAIPNTTPTDCIRLHYIRTDDVKDGMSYNVDCTVTPNSPVTVSFYTRAANANAVGKVIQYYIYNYVGGNPTAYSWNFTLGQVGVWERQTFTYTPVNQVMISYWFPQSSGVYSWDWSCMQVEQKSYVTNFVAGTRGTTVATGGGWADMSGNGNNGELVNGTRESSDNLGALVFDGTNDYISVPYSSVLDTPNGATYSVWIYPTSSGEFLTRGTSDSGATPDNPRFYIDVSVKQIYFDWSSPGSDRYLYTSSNSFENNKWMNIVGVAVAGGRLDVYVNGSLCAYQTRSNVDTMPNPLPNTNNEIQIGGVTWVPRYFGGRISSVNLYNRALTAAEIQQNFNANRARFGI